MKNCGSFRFRYISVTSQYTLNVDPCDQEVIVHNSPPNKVDLAELNNYGGGGGNMAKRFEDHLCTSAFI